MTVWIQSPFDNLPAEGYRKQRYWLMAEAFAAAGYRVVYFTAGFNHVAKAPRALLAESAEASGISTVVVPVPAYSANVSVRRAFSHAVYARRLKSAALELAASEPAARPGLVVSATPTLGAASSMMGLARRFGAKFVLDVQDAWPETFGRLLPKCLGRAGDALLAPMRIAARRLYREADAVTGVSERYRGVCGREDYRLFYHGIESARPSDVRPRPDRERTRLVYIGNIGEGYDLDTVAGALALDSRLTLDVAGSGPREASFRQTVGRLGLGGRVRFHGYLGADELRRLLADCDIGVIPMRDDSWVGLPYKLGDYLAAALPVVSSLHGECGALISEFGLGATYDFGSPESAAAAIRVLARHGAVSLPDCLRAEAIYPAYVGFAASV